MPHRSTPGAPRRVARFAPAIIWAAAAAVVLAAALAPRFAQPEDYHQFADQRPNFGLPNFFDVASNLAFVVVGLLGLRFVARGRLADGRPAFEHASERWAWGTVFAATALTCIGSGYYHLSPDSPRLAWDRLPMAVAFMGLVAATVSERVSPEAGRRLLVPLVLLGAGSVWYWRWSAARGIESLNPYGAVQFGSMLIVLLMMGLLPSRYTHARDILGALGLYALAKVFEHFDRGIFAATGGLVSGHTLKHLVAAGAMWWLLRMLARRRPAGQAVT